MKRLTFLALVLFLIHAAPCISNNSIVVENAKWNIFRQSFESAALDIWTESVIIKRDTIINNLVYKNIYQNSSKNEIDTALIGHIREDSTGKVFIRSIKFDQDFLLYDFGLKQGDSTTLVYWTILYYSRVTPSKYANIKVRMDSIEPILLNGIERIKYHISTTTEIYPYWFKTNTWISGIGDMEGILYSCNNPGWSGVPISRLLCSSLSDNLIFMNPEFNSCYITNVVAINVPETEEYLFFDPTTKTLKINNKQGKLLQIDIFDIFGKLLLTKTKDENTSEINLQMLPKGIYLAKVVGPKKHNTLQFILN